MKAMIFPYCIFYWVLISGMLSGDASRHEPIEETSSAAVGLNLASPADMSTTYYVAQTRWASDSNLGTDRRNPLLTMGEENGIELNRFATGIRNRFWRFLSRGLEQVPGEGSLN